MSSIHIYDNQRMTEWPYSLDGGPDRSELLSLYEMMMRLRTFEMKVHELCAAKELGGCHLYAGQEASAVGVCAHLTPDDWAVSNHRSHGHALAKGVPPKLLMAELFGKATGTNGGRGGTQHVYYKPAGFCCSNGFIAGGVPHTVGFALSSRVRNAGEVAVAFLGDGGTGHGAFHEAINFAGAQKAGVVFVCENNGYATETPFTAATANTDVASKAAGYGIPGIRVDGNDVVAVWTAMKQAVDRARSGDGPTLIEVQTCRWFAHCEGGAVCGTSNYRTEEEVQSWIDRCPIKLLRRQLLQDWRIANEDELNAIDARVHEEIEDAVGFARQSPYPTPESLHEHVYAEPVAVPISDTTKVTRQNWIKAVAEGIAEEIRRNPNIICMGEGVGKRPGVVGQTAGLWEEFGGEHIIDTPISELGFTGAGVGASLKGTRAIADLMCSPFLLDAASQIAHQAARLHYVSNGQLSVPLIVRALGGYSTGQTSSHGATYHSVWAHIPGLTVVIPSNPADAKGLMKTALRGENPVIFFDHPALIKTEGDVPVGEDVLVPFGKARIVREGTDITIISCGLMLHRSVEAAERLKANGISCDVIDLRTIVPLDVDCIVQSATKTGHALVIDEDWSMCGLGAEIAATVMERAFGMLKSPVGRLHLEPVSHPFSSVMDDINMPTVEKIVDYALSVINGTSLLQRRVFRL